jgi:hypothetical protein
MILIAIGYTLGFGGPEFQQQWMAWLKECRAIGQI